MIDRTLFNDEFFQALGGLTLPRRLRSGTDTGLHETNRLGESLEFAELRPYQSGDDLRQVDWNAYRRFRRLLVRRYQAERSHDVYIVIDTSASMAVPPNRFARSKQIAGAIAVLAARRQDRVTLMSFSGAVDDLFVQSRRDRGALRLLERLSLMKASGTTDVAGCLTTAADHIRRNSLLVLISDFLAVPEAMEAALTVFERLSVQILFIQVTAREERDPVFRGDVLLEDSETGQFYETRSRGRAIEAYRKRFQDHTALLSLHAAAHGGRLAAVNSENSLAAVLKEVLFPV